MDMDEVRKDVQKEEQKKRLEEFTVRMAELLRRKEGQKHE